MTFVANDYKPGDFRLVFDGVIADIYADREEYPGVKRALMDLRDDIHRVTGCLPKVKTDQDLTHETVIVGTIGKSPLIDSLIAAGRLDALEIKGRWEAHVVQVVPNPLPNVGLGLVVAGSDKRGTIYGIYEISRQIGVSPWYWWADVIPERQKALVIRSGVYKRKEPSVKYRGIFLNNEWPSLGVWAHGKFGGFNHLFYTKVFELILRLKGNLLWPAMWKPANFYRDDPLNGKLADEYGIVMATSHHEPMMRSWVEWEQYGTGEWNYSKNRENLLQFWRDGIRISKDCEKLVTIGMRGDGDEPMMDDGTLQERMAVMERIIADQRQILSDITGKSAAEAPQVFALYKEVQEFWEAGINIPDDVTILLANDNFGNIRMVPKETERNRPGGYGMYYHFDYVGGPKSYRWLDTVPFPKIWEQMRMAYDYGVDRIWIVNVGDLKGHEVPTEFFLDLAYDIHKWNKDNLMEFTSSWAEREFGPEVGKTVGEVVWKYIKYNGRRKPEHIQPDTYSVLHYREAERVLAAYEELVKASEAIYAKLPEAKRDAFFQLVLYPVRGSANVLKLNVLTALNHLYAQQGRVSANTYADLAAEVFAKEAEDTAYYNHTLAGGKWQGVMKNGHIGQTGWRIPERNIMPEVKRVQVKPGADMGVAVEGSAQVWVKNKSAIDVLPAFHSLLKERHFFEVFNMKGDPFTVEIEISEPWIIVEGERNVTEQQRFWVDIDWDRAPVGEFGGTIAITGTGKQITVMVMGSKVKLSDLDRLEPMTFIEANGYVSIEAEHFARNAAVDGIKWERIPDYGRTLGSMAVFPKPCPIMNPPEHAPYLEYNVYLTTTGEVTVWVYSAPSNNIDRTRGLCYGISFDDQPVQIVDTFPKENDAFYTSRLWSIGVMDNIRKTATKHEIKTPGLHRLRFWLVDPAVVLQKIVIDAGGVKPSFLSPPESFFAQPEDGDEMD
jgi:hypothetical protein